jgi:hypothetical protein
VPDWDLQFLGLCLQIDLRSVALCSGATSVGSLNSSENEAHFFGSGLDLAHSYRLSLRSCTFCPNLPFDTCLHVGADIQSGDISCVSLVRNSCPSECLISSDSPLMLLLAGRHIRILGSNSDRRWSVTFIGCVYAPRESFAVVSEQRVRPTGMKTAIDGPEAALPDARSGPEPQQLLVGSLCRVSGYVICVGMQNAALFRRVSEGAVPEICVARDSLVGRMMRRASRLADRQTFGAFGESPPVPGAASSHARGNTIYDRKFRKPNNKQV